MFSIKGKRSDGYIAYKSIIKQKLRPRTNELKMSLTIEEFFESYLNRNKYLNNENIRQISLYKLIYFYLIESKRLLGVDLFAIYLTLYTKSFTLSHTKYIQIMNMI